MNREDMIELAVRTYKVPEHTAPGLVDYVLKGTQTGHFLQAVFENNLMRALSQADLTNRDALYDICVFLFTECPVACYGSRKAYGQWIEAGGLEGYEREAANEVAG